MDRGPSLDTPSLDTRMCLTTDAAGVEKYRASSKLLTQRQSFLKLLNVRNHLGNISAPAESLNWML